MDERPKILCFELPNLPGTLELVVSALADARVNINSLMAHGGQLVLNVDDPETLRSVLRRQGISFHETSACGDDALTTAGDVADRLRAAIEQLDAVVGELERNAVAPARPSEAQREALLRTAADLSALAAL
jgi:hypothetical protein